MIIYTMSYMCLLVIDASKKSGTRLVGDVDYKEAKMKASWITPVPGGMSYILITSAIS